MFSRFFRTALLLSAVLAAPADSKAFECLNRLFGCGRTTYAQPYAPAAYYAPAPACAPAPVCAPAPCTPCPQTCQYVPETHYRTVYQPVAVTSYRPTGCCGWLGNCCGGSAPVTTYRPQLALMPYTTYRMVCTNSCAPCATTASYAAPMSYASPASYAAPATGCATCVSGATVTSSPAISYGAPATSAGPTTFAAPATAGTPATSGSADASPSLNGPALGAPATQTLSPVAPSNGAAAPRAGAAPMNWTPTPANPNDRQAMWPAPRVARVELISSPAAPQVSSDGWRAE
jgi:hypothetical protein